MLPAQAFPQAPQLLRSLVMVTHEPPHSTCPALQVADAAAQLTLASNKLHALLLKELGASAVANQPSRRAGAVKPTIA
jgi:hypothetical protein